MGQNLVRLTKRFISRRTVPAVGVCVVLLVCAGLMLYPELLSLSPHPLDTKSNSLDVRGIYWTLPVANVDSLALVSNELTVTGKLLPFPGLLGKHQISRTIPGALFATKLQPDYGWTTWTVTDLIINPAGKNIFWHSIMDLQSGKRFAFAVKSKDFYPIFKFYHGRGDTSVAIFAFAKSGRGKKSMMGYLLITGKVSK